MVSHQQNSREIVDDICAQSILGGLSPPCITDVADVTKCQRLTNHQQFLYEHTLHTREAIGVEFHVHVHGNADAASTDGNNGDE